MSKEFRSYRDSAGEMFSECHYYRFQGERTNIYGLSVVKSTLPTWLPQAPEFPSHIYTVTTIPERRPLPTSVPRLKFPRKHAFTASLTKFKAFAADDGFWNTIDIPLYTDRSRQVEIISTEVFERIIEVGKGQAQYGLIVAIASFQSSHSGGAPDNSSSSDSQNSQFVLDIFGARMNPSPYLEDILLALGDSCQTIKLNAAPMQMHHTSVYRLGRKQAALLVCVMDGIVHMFCEENYSGNFKEYDAAECFPLLGRLAKAKVNVMSLAIFNLNDMRFFVAGGQNGELHLSVCKLEDSTEGKCYREVSFESRRMFSPISSVLVFPHYGSPKKMESNPSAISLVVTCAIEQARVYSFIPTNGLLTSLVLPESTDHDSILCSHVMDVDWDGEMEVLIGTYGRQVLIYKRTSDEPKPKYDIIWRRSFAFPVYRMTSLDIDCDGLEELIVVTMYGVHIFQTSAVRGQKRLLEVIRTLKALKSDLIDSSRVEK